MFQTVLCYNGSVFLQGGSMEHNMCDILNDLPIYVTKVSLDLNVVWMNNYASEEGQLIGIKCYKGFNPDLEQCTFCPVVRAITSKEKEVSLIEIEVDGDKDRVFEVTAIPSFDGEQLVGIYEIRKEVTHQLVKKSIPVEKPKKQKNNILTSNNLLDIVSHELKDQVAVASKHHDRLSNTKLTQDQRLQITGMRIAFLKIENIISNIQVMRNFKRELNKQSKKKINLKSIVTEAFSQYQDKSDFNGNSLDYKFDSEIPLKLIMDKKKMSLIISNLIDYSMTNTSNRYISVMVTLVDEKQDSVDIDWKIKNVGSIAVHDAVKRDFSSYIKSNLALSVIKNLVETQGGSFKMLPVNGYGIELLVSMRFKKPFAMAKLPFLKSLAEKSIKTLGSPSNKIRKKILIAEDEPIGRITIEQMLKNDYDIILAKNGKVAVEKYFSEQPDLVIMDIMMPILNGFDAFDQIERNCINRVPIIACTAKVIKSEKEYLKSYGFDDYIAKPVSAKTLREIISRHIAL